VDISIRLELCSALTFVYSTMGVTARRAGPSAIADTCFRGDDEPHVSFHAFLLLISFFGIARNSAFTGYNRLFSQYDSCLFQREKNDFVP